MKVTIIGHYGDDYVTLGTLALVKGKVVPTVNREYPDPIVAVHMLTSILATPVEWEGETYTAEDRPGPFLGHLHMKYSGSYLRATVVTEETPKKKTKKEYDESEHPRDESGKWTGGGGHTWHSPTPEAFLAARGKNPRQEFFSHLEPKDLKDYKLIMTPDGSAGAAVAPGGDIQSVFRNPDGGGGMGTEAVREAVRHGGRMLDAFDGVLPGVYRKAGFVETGRMKFNPAYGPTTLHASAPDIVFMAHVGGDQTGSPKAINYYASHEWDKAKADSLAAAKEPAIDRQLREQNARRHEKPALPPAVDRALSGLGKAMTADDESAIIAENKKEWGDKTHRFVAAEWTHPNGHPRCIRCGDEEPMDGLCMPGLQKWAAMLDAWSTKYAEDFRGRIELQEGPVAKRNWIAQYHKTCVEKGEACKVSWPVCPMTKPVEKVEKYITGSDGKFTVHAEDGKVLGTHGTKGEAEAQLRAIEANKHGTSKDVAWPVTPSKPGYGDLPALAGEKAPNAKAMKALQVAFREYAKAEGIVVKIEEVMCAAVEATDDGDVYKIEYGTGRAYFKEADGQAVHLAQYHQKGSFVPITKAESQHYTLGAVYAPGERDFHGDTMTEVELEKAAWMFAQKDGLTSRVGLMHQSGTNGAGKVVESYIYRGPVWTMKDTSGKEQTIVPGTWMLGTVWESEAWQRIERGELKGYSLQGVARKWADGKEI